MLLSFGLSSEPLPAMAATGGDEKCNTHTPPVGDIVSSVTLLYPADVQTVINDEGRQIIRTYTLTTEQSPADISRDSFIRDGWQYTLTDITERRTSETDSRSHTETLTIDTDSNDMNAILALLSPTMEYQSADGFSGILALDMSSVKCEVAGRRNSSFTVTATREYPHLSTNDTSLIPKTITDNDRVLELDNVLWEVQHTVNVDYYDIPTSYRAIATYTAKATRSVVTGYVTTANYTGEISTIVTGDTVYSVHFHGTEINPAPEPTPEPLPVTDKERGAFPVLPLIIGLVILTALAGSGAYFVMRRNVRIYRDGFRILAAKDKISAKKMLIDLTPLDGKQYGIVISKFTAKSLNHRTVEIIYGPVSLKHKIAYEGNTYRIEVDFSSGSIQAVY
jgi:hypothetical protein